MSAERLVTLREDLVGARESLRQASYIESYPKMQREQTRWVAEVDRLKAEIAALEDQQ